MAPGNAESLAQAIEELLTNGALRQSYGDAGRTYAEQTFDLWKNGRRLAELLRVSTRRPSAVSSLQAVSG